MFNQIIKENIFNSYNIKIDKMNNIFKKFYCSPDLIQGLKLLIFYKKYG